MNFMALMGNSKRARALVFSTCALITILCPTGQAKTQSHKGRAPNFVIKPQNSNQIEVTPLDADFPTRPLEEAGYRVQQFGVTNAHSDEQGNVPDPQVRDRILQEAGLLPHLKNWDHFERDMLFLRSQQRNTEELSHIYPNIPVQKFKHLKKILLDAGTAQ